MKYMADPYKLNKSSKIFFLLMFLLIVTVVSFMYYKFIFAGNYTVEGSGECDPAEQSCFVHVCDTAMEEECSGDIAQDTSYYKLIHRLAKNIPLCDPNNEDCQPFACPQGESGCEDVYCSEESVLMIEGDRCSDASDSITNETSDTPEATDESDGENAGETVSQDQEESPATEVNTDEMQTGNPVE